MIYKTLLLGAASLACLNAALAQDSETKTLDTVTIEGSRLDQAETEIGSSVSVITADDIDLLGYDFAVDAIAAAPGVTINQNGAFGGSASIRIRGASSEQTLVLIDGVTVNDPTSPGGGFNFARLDTESIERIEILKGPQSTLWGTDAIGGVVSITTKRPEDGFGGTAFGEFGSFNTFRGGASVNAANDTGDFRLALTGTTTDGISKADEDNGNTEDDGFDSYTFSGRAGLNLPANARLDGSLVYTDAEAEFDSFSFGAQGNVGDGDEVSETEELSAHIALKLPLLNDRFENLFLVNFSEIDRQNYTNGASSFGSDGDRMTYRYQGTFTVNDQNKIAFGAEREDSEANGSDTSIDGLFALYEFKPVETVTLTGGLRVDDHERFGSETTGRVAAAYNPNEQMTLRASWGQGFKAPTIFQTTFFCCGATEPNPLLQPETSDAFDVGADWRSVDGRAEAGITYFDQDTDNLIRFANGSYENISQVSSRGVELYGSYQLNDWLKASANYAYIDAEAEGASTQLVRVPVHSGDVTLAIDPKGPFSGAVLVRYNGDENDNNGEVPAWGRVDLSGAYEVSEKVELFGRVENLFDEDYQQILGYGTPGISGSIGVRLRY